MLFTFCRKPWIQNHLSNQMKVSLRLKLLAKPSLPNIHFYFLPNLADHGFQMISIYQISKIRKLELDTFFSIFFSMRPAESNL